ncbi:MAG: AAA family ATPase, partial [Saprospiraceae bacterium]|nr:AAA family ATPase [Saprospiraceae bacterium]
MDTPQLIDERRRIESAIQALESQRALLGDAAVEAALGALRLQLAGLNQPLEQELRLTGERKLVTVMFADISGFTTLSEKHDPEEIRALMNACFDHLVPVAQEYAGTVDKFIGDEIMVLFGAPKAHERHAELACFAALDMFDALQDFNRKNGIKLEMHIGINTGLVIAGGIGSKGRQEYSVMGDAVNLAARLKDAAARGQTFVGPDVFSLTGHSFNYNTLPPLRLKGKNEPVRTYSLQSRKTNPGGGREGSLYSDLIGREEELRQMTSLLLDLHNGRGNLLAIIGEAGIGKSRLVTEIRNRVKDQANWVEGRSLSNSRQRMYQPALEIMARLLAVSADMEGEQIKPLLQKELEHTLGANGKTYLPFLSQMMQLPLTEEEDIAVRYLNTGTLRERIFSAFSEYIEAKTRQAPLILVWEDLHWSDPSSLALIEHTLSFCRSCPLAIVLVFRPRKEERVWQLHEEILKKFVGIYHVFHLEPLTAKDSALLMRKLIHVENLDADVERIILDKAEGNPFFVEELLRSLLDNGMLYLEGQMIKASDTLDRLTIPGTLQGVIASRIDQLDGIDKLNLQTASILGRIFQEEVLSSLLSKLKQDASLAHSLTQLVEREMLRRRLKEEREVTEYIFKHAVTHDVAYNSLLLSDRKMMHRLAGETIEELTDPEKDDYAESLAYHYERADQQEKAVHFLRRAAGRAKKLHSNEEAVELYRRAIRQAEELLQQESNAAPWRRMLSDLLENQADILKLTGQPDKAKATYEQALEQVDAHDRIGQARILRKTGLCFQASSQFLVILDYFHRAQQLLEQDADNKTPEWWHDWIELLNERMFIYYWMNDPGAMQELSKTIQSSMELYGTPIQQARYYQNLVALNFRLERYLLSDQTVMLARKLVESALVSRDLQMISVAKFFLGFSLLWHNDCAESMAVMEESLALAEQTGDLIIKTRNLTYLAVVHRRQGNLAQTEHYTGLSLDIARNAGMLEYVGTAYANLAWLAWKKGDLESVEIQGEQAYNFWKKVPETHSSIVFGWTAAWPLA